MEPLRLVTPATQQKDAHILSATCHGRSRALVNRQTRTARITRHGPTHGTGERRSTSAGNLPAAPETAMVREDSNQAATPQLSCRKSPLIRELARIIKVDTAYNAVFIPSLRLTILADKNHPYEPCAPFLRGLKMTRDQPIREWKPEL